MKRSFMRVFVIGGTGFLGSRVVAKAISEGHEVYALSRRPENDKYFVNKGAFAVRGSLPGAEYFANTLGKIDAVIHCAAPVVFWGKVVAL